MIRGGDEVANLSTDIEIGHRPIFYFKANTQERTNGGEFTIHPIAFMITFFRNWLYYAFSKMHPVMDDGATDAVIVIIDGEEGENESNRMCL